MDPYKVLNIPFNATEQEIKDAYNTLKEVYAPKQHMGLDSAEVAEKYGEINKAYLAAMKNLRKSEKALELQRMKEGVNSDVRSIGMNDFASNGGEKINGFAGGNDNGFELSKQSNGPDGLANSEMSESALNYDPFFYSGNNQENSESKEPKQIELRDMQMAYYQGNSEGTKYYRGGIGGSYADYGENSMKEYDSGLEQGGRYGAYYGYGEPIKEEDYFDGGFRGAFDPKFNEFLDMSSFSISGLGLDESYYRNAMKSIEAWDFKAAVIILRRISKKTALWFYLNGVAHRGLGDIVKATENAMIAYNMEQDNMKFWQFLKFMRESTSAYTDSTLYYESGKKTIRRDMKGTIIVGTILFIVFLWVASIVFKGYLSY